MQRFPSKIDAWLAILVFGPLSAVLVNVLVSDDGHPVDFLIVAGALALAGWLFATTRYDVDGDALRITTGPMHTVIPLADIREVTPSRNPVAGPALSLDRLRIDYGNGRSICVSPADREGFLKAIGRELKGG